MLRQLMRQLMPATLICTSLLLSACGFTPFLYKTDIVQGNLYTQEDVARIQPGMTQSEVRRILGTSTLKDPFAPNIDIYPYYYRAGKTDHIYQGSLTIYYNQAGVVTQVEEQKISREE